MNIQASQSSWDQMPKGYPFFIEMGYDKEVIKALFIGIGSHFSDFFLINFLDSF